MSSYDLFSIVISIQSSVQKFETTMIGKHFIQRGVSPTLLLDNKDMLGLKVLSSKKVPEACLQYLSCTRQFVMRCTSLLS